MDPARQRLPRGYGVVWTTVAIDLVGFGIVAPILPLYAERFGASGLTVGLLFASFSLAQFVCAPFAGRLSDRVGRKPVILLSLFGTALGSLVTGAANALWLVFLGRILDGASGASVSVAQGAVADLAPPDQRARLIGLLGAAFGVGFVVGPAIGSLAALGGAHVPFYVAAAIAFANGVVAIVRLPETRPVAGGDAVATGVGDGAAESVAGGPAVATGVGDGAATAGRQWRPEPGALARFALVGFLLTCAFSGFESTFALFAGRRFGLTEASVAVVFVGIGLVLVAVQGGLIAKVSARLGSAHTLRLALSANAAGMVVLAAATSWLALVPALVLLTVGQGLAIPSLTTLVVDRAPVARRGEALGFQQSATALARIGGPALGGALFQHAGVPWPYAVAAGLLVVALVVLAGAADDRAPGTVVTMR